MELPEHSAHRGTSDVRMTVTNGDVGSTVIETDFLIVGAGPAGAALACFMVQHGLKPLMISSAPGTANTPRAHVINPAGMEILRDIGLEDEALKNAHLGDALCCIRWARSMVGEEFGRIHAWGYAPNRKGENEAASPCCHVDLPQTLLEPLLVRYATNHGVEARFSTSFIDFERDGEYIVSAVKDNINQHTYRIRSRYLFGCDGAKSKVARTLDLPFEHHPSGGVAYNVLINADLEDVMKHQMGQLHWIMQPDKEPIYGLGPVMRMVKPWKQWLLVCFPKPGASSEGFAESTKNDPEFIEFLKDVIGDHSIDVEIDHIAPWTVRESFAKTYSGGRSVFCLGDAVHRHPPTFGLGSNTCMQDAYNLAWKIALVSKGLAGPGLLDTYDPERVPVGENLVTQSNIALRAHAGVWDALGMFGGSIEERVRLNNQLSESTKEGAARRAQLHSAIEDGAKREGESLGIVMNQWYASSAVYLDDETSRSEFAGDPVMDHLISTYPGTRMPHAWLSKTAPSKKISTIDLAGKGAFCLLTGHGGDAWREAAKKVGGDLGIAIRSFSIGRGLDYRDIYRDWQKRKEIEESGCLLIRPDRFVAWRSKTIVPDCDKKLSHVLRTILSRMK